MPEPQSTPTCPHGLPLDRSIFLSDECRDCNLEIVQRNLGLMREKNTKHLNIIRRRFKINLLDYPTASSIEALRTEIHKENDAFVAAWVNSIHSMNFDWLEKFGDGGGKEPNFAAEINHIDGLIRALIPRSLNSRVLN